MTGAPTNRKQQIREYLTAFGTAFVAAAIGLFNVDDVTGDLPIEPSALLSVILIFGGAIVMFFLMMRLRTPSTEQDENDSAPPLPAERMVRMSVLWYGLSIVLCIGLIRQAQAALSKTYGGFDTHQAINLTLALGITSFAVHRLYKVWRTRQRNEHTDND